jgi:Flp pilus assembly protein TadG
MVDQRGGAAVELAAIMLTLLVFVFGVVDFGRLMFDYAMLAHAVDAAARCFSVDSNTCATGAQTQTYAVNQAWTLGLTTSAFTVGTTSCGARVVGSMTFVFSTPLTGMSSMPLTAMACYPS